MLQGLKKPGERDREMKAPTHFWGDLQVWVDDIEIEIKELKSQFDNIAIA